MSEIAARLREVIVSNSLPAIRGMSERHTNRSNQKECSNMHRNESRFGYWNISTMSGREEELVDKMQKYVLDVLGVSKAKVKGNAVKCTGDVTYVFGCTRW